MISKNLLPVMLATCLSAMTAPSVMAAIGPNGNPFCTYQSNSWGPRGELKPGTPLTDQNLNYCKGGPDCTPFYYKPYVQSFSGFGPLGWTRYNEATGYFQGKSQRVWASCNTGDKSQCDGYWVFHSGDGAGIEDDCVGDISYTERFGRRIGSVNDSTPRSLSTWCSADKNGRTNSPICPFVHPGSQDYYTDYASGWISCDGMDCGRLTKNSMASAASGGWTKSVQENIYTLMNDPSQNPWLNSTDSRGNKINMQFILFPWVCAHDNRKGGNNFSYPTLTESEKYKCYADNEPGRNGWPPVMEIYSILPSSETIEGKQADVLKGKEWVYTSDMTANEAPRFQKSFTLYACTAKDNCPSWAKKSNTLKIG